MRFVATVESGGHMSGDRSQVAKAGIKLTRAQRCQQLFWFQQLVLSSTDSFVGVAFLFCTLLAFQSGFRSVKRGFDFSQKILCVVKTHRALQN